VTVQLKRVYDAPSGDDGYRVLVDRLWPRGLSRASADVDLWLKEVAPSPDLRKWFDHREDRFAAFADRYDAELDGNPAVDELRDVVASHPTVTLLYGAKDPAVNHAVVLADHLRR